MSTAAHRATWGLWLGGLAVVTAGLVSIRGVADPTHVALTYLLLVLLTSARAGRSLGLALSVASFLAFNFFFVPPYHTLSVAAPRDWLVLIAFLITSLVAAHLLARARSEAASAEQRAGEVERLSMLGAEALNAGRPLDALAGIAEVIRSALTAARCEIHGRDGIVGNAVLMASSGTAPALEAARPFGQPSDYRQVEWVAEHASAAVELPDGAVRSGAAGVATQDLGTIDLTGARALLVPLMVRQRTVGVLRIIAHRTFALQPAQRRFLEALSYYAALGVERVRLAAEAERAEALSKADELKDALLASVSHDLRTPLTTIKALAHDIARDGDDRAITIEEEADRLNRFVADLLDLSRIAGGALQVRPEVNAVEDLIGAAVQRVGGAVQDGVLVASLDPTEPLLLARFDFVHSLRIVTNLLENAAKYAPAGTTIELRAVRRGDAVDIAVLDRGPGIPEHLRARMFEPFSRLPGSPPDAGGVGLGLSIAQGLAVAQGGSVRYEARNGGGSVFTLTLPALDAADVEALVAS